jgi:flagellar assembly protein FliH
LSRLFRIQERNVRSVWIPQIVVNDVIETNDDCDNCCEPSVNAAEEARMLLEQAKEQAENLLDEACKEAREIMKQTYQRGLEEGRRKGMEEGLEHAEVLVKQAEELVQSAKEEIEKQIRETEPKLLALAIEAAKKLVGDCLNLDPRPVLDMIRRGINALQDEREFSIIVNPSLVSFLKEHKETICGEFNARDIEFLGDEDVEHGIKIKTKHGIVDLTLDSQIRNIASAIAEARQGLTDGS